MKLNIEQIRQITRGVVRIEEEQDGVHFYRFTKAQEELYRSVSNDFFKKSHATAGVRMEFLTNSETLEIKTKVSSGSSRTYFAFDVFVNGELKGYLANFNEDDVTEDYISAEYEWGDFSKTFLLGEGEKTVTIYFPWSAVAVMEALIVDDDAFVEPTKEKKKLLVYGDSITQGYDALRPSHRYASRIADAFGLEEVNKAIGGEVHRAALAEEKDDFTPDYIMIAYGTNDWSKCPKADVKANCEGFYKAIRNHYPETPILTIAPIWRKDGQDYREFGQFHEMEELIRETVKPYDNITVISGYDFVPKEEKYFADKRLHPNDAGFECYFHNLYKAITKILYFFPNFWYTHISMTFEEKNSMKWNKFRLTTTTESEDLVSSMLMDLGIQGIEIEDKIPLTQSDKEQMFVDILPEIAADDGVAYISFYLEEEDDKETILANVKQELEDMRAYANVGECTIEESQTEDVDWVNNWKQYFHQFYVDDILIIPSWEEVKPEDEDKMIIHIDPGTAFGTGMHETTQLCIRQIRKFVKEDTTILDVGCGSGILGMLALKFGAKYSVGTDLDPCAIDATYENMEVNGITRDQYEVMIGNIISDKDVQDKVGYGKYDIVVANILADVLVPLTPVIVNQLKTGGIYITSGIIDDKEETVVNCVKEAGLEVLEVTYQGEWVSVTARKN